jgi:hypothetical protein
VPAAKFFELIEARQAKSDVLKALGTQLVA